MSLRRDPVRDREASACVILWWIIQGLARCERHINGSDGQSSAWACWSSSPCKLLGWKTFKKKKKKTTRSSSFLQCLHPTPVWTEWPGGLRDETKAVLGSKSAKAAHFPACRPLSKASAANSVLQKELVIFLIDSAQNCNPPINQHQDAARRTSRSGWDQFNHKRACVKQITAPACTNWGNDHWELASLCAS